MDEVRNQKIEREINNELQGIKVDVEFQAMVEVEKEKIQTVKPHAFAD